MWRFEEVGIVDILKGMVPLRLRKAWGGVRWKNYEKKLLAHIVNDEYQNKDVYSDEINWLIRENRLEIFPYDFIKQYNANDITIHTDIDGDKYANIYGDKKLFLKDVNPGSAEILNAINQEQDVDSPHRYFTNTFYPRPSDVLLDIGAAEGKEALELIDKVKCIHLFEPDNEWCRLLKKTFFPYMDHTYIHNLFVGKNDKEQFYSLDSLFINNIGPYVLKVDVEGFELDVLSGAEKILALPDTRIAIATYHSNNAAKEIKEFLEERHYKTEFSKGYALWKWDPHNLSEPYFRKCVLRAWK